MLKDEQNFSHNGAVDAKPLKNGQNFHPFSTKGNVGAYAAKSRRPCTGQHIFTRDTNNSFQWFSNTNTKESLSRGVCNSLDVLSKTVYPNSSRGL